MTLDFNMENVTVTEFGVGWDDHPAQTFALVPVGSEVQVALGEIVKATWDALQAAMPKDANGPARYEPSEKHGSIEYLYLSLDDRLARTIRVLHRAENLDIDVNALDEPSGIFCYFARFRDSERRRLTALRRAGQFKGILKSRGRLVRMLNDTLMIIEDTVFKLDNVFDLLADSSTLHILRPRSFEFAGNLQQAILDAVPENIKAVQEDLPFVELSGIEEYAREHSLAARYLASIRGRKSKNVDKDALERYCGRNQVIVTEEQGKLVVAAGHELDFLRILDRRLYDVELVLGETERYRALSRTKVND